jgi:hypothetical protein
MTRANHRTRTDLSVRMTFESTRLSPAFVSEAYAILMPIARRQVLADRHRTVAPATSSSVRVGGKRR